MYKDINIEKVITLLKRLAVEVEQRYKARIKGIFGSYARGEEDARSDIDVLVEFDSDADLVHFVGVSLFLEEKLGRKVDVVPYDSIRAEIKEGVLKEAVYL